VLCYGRIVANESYGVVNKARIMKNPDFRTVFAVEIMYELVYDILTLEFLNLPTRHPELFKFARKCA